MSSVVRKIKVGACQLPDIQADLEKALSLVEEFAVKAFDEDVGLLCFPECFLQGYLLERKQARRHALDLRSPAFSEVLDRLSHLKPTLVIGLVEVEDDLLYNTAVVITQGRLRGAYRKVHLLESESVFQPGRSYPVFEMEGFRFGINICCDARFPEAAKALADHGGRVILCPANNMLEREIAEKWKDLHNEIRMERALETRLWVVSSDITGKRDGCVALGPTAVISPDGNVLEQVPPFEIGMVLAEIEYHREKTWGLP